MKAIVQRRYGLPDVLTLEDVPEPVAKDDELLVRVRAASVNPYDWHFMEGTPYLVRLVSGLRKPKLPVRGVDLAGEVAAVGTAVTRFRPGDRVFAMHSGAFAEFACVREGGTVLAMPSNLTFEQAAAVPLAALTALQGLRDKGKLQPGQKVLVNGASGGIGTFAVQIAKSFGAEVTGVCSTGNVEMVRSIGADRVIDYTREDYARDGAPRYNLILDLAGTRTFRKRKRALNPGGILVAVGGPITGQWLGPLTGELKRTAASLGGDRKLVGMLTKARAGDLATVRTLLEAGKVVPVIDRSYPLSEVPDAIAYAMMGHARGKVVITI